MSLSLNRNEIAFFSSYLAEARLPYYLKCYLRELCRHVQRVVLFSQPCQLPGTDIEFLENENIEWITVENHGYDFGMWHEAFARFPVHDFERIVLANDSCVLFASLKPVFEALANKDWEYAGLVDSDQCGHHLQSYFLVIKGSAVKAVADYFKQIGKLKRFEDVIERYEVGLSAHLKEQGLRLGALYSNYHSTQNPAFFSVEELIRDGCPLLKRKLLFGNYRLKEIPHLAANGFDFDPNKYFGLLENSPGSLILDLDKLKADCGYPRSRKRLVALNQLAKPLGFAKKLLCSTPTSNR